jgi:hypothetical protein
MNQSSPEAKKCPDCQGKGYNDFHTGQEPCLTCMETGLAPMVEPGLPRGKSYCACDIFITDSRRPTHCRYCGQRKPPEKDSVKSQSFVKAMTAHIEAGGKFESTPEAVSEKAQATKIYSLAWIGSKESSIDAIHRELEAIASHIRSTEVDPLKEALDASEEYCQHDPGCGLHHGNSKCDCGLKTLRDKIAAYQSTKEKKS